MHFSEIRAVAMLAILLTGGIMLADRLAPTGMSRPTETMTTAMTAAEKTASATRVREEAAAAARESQAMVNTSGGAAGPLAGTVTASGYHCPAVRRVAPISSGNGIYRMVCSGAGGDASYRIDTRRGKATLETAPIA